MQTTWPIRSRLTEPARDDELRPAPARRAPDLLVPLEFIRRVLTGFRKTHGFLLASAVAYNALLSIVPLFAVLLALLSGLVDEQLLQRTISRWVEQLLPGRSASITDQLPGFLAHGEAV